MTRTWLVLDCNYLCHRAFHSVGQLSEGVIFGFLHAVVSAQQLHQTHRTVFCFDYGHGKRYNMLNGYKSSRKKKYKDWTRSERTERQKLNLQIEQLRAYLLRRIGWRNVLFQEGYEADDLIASVCLHSIKAKDKAIIVSSDTDLYQLLSGNVHLWNPHKSQAFTLASFRTKYGIEPGRWAEVKALAGCNTDDVPGIPGVGEKTAAKWVAGKLKVGSKAFEKVLLGVAEATERNLPIVRLPLQGTNTFRLKKDRITISKWREHCLQLGMHSLISNPPLMRKK